MKIKAGLNPVKSKILHIIDLIKHIRNEEDDKPTFQVFLTLPSRRHLPDYFEIIKDPIALNTMRVFIDGENCAFTILDESGKWRVYGISSI